MSKNSGFTLIELLTVVAIIGILAAIAVPQFAEYRKRGFDARTVSALRNAATGEEAYFSAHEVYVSCANLSLCEAALPAFRSPLGVVLEMADIAASGASPEHFTGSAYHQNGTHDSPSSAYQWDSSAGGLQ